MRFFTTTTPAGRLEYFLVALVTNIAFIAAVIIVLGLQVTLGDGSTPGVGYNAASLATFGFISLAVLFFQVVNCLRRMKDLHMSSTWIIALFIPIVSFLFQLQLLFSSGVKRETFAPYGEDPYDPDSWVPPSENLENGGPGVTFQGQALLLPGEDSWDDQAA